MTFDPEPTLRAVAAILSDLRADEAPRFAQVLIGPRPLATLPSGYSAVVAMDRMEIAVPMPLNSTTELHVVVARIYRAMAEGAPEATEIALASVVPQILAAVRGSYTLGSQIRAVDFGGIHGERPHVDFGDEEIAGRPYWTAHLYLPCIVDDVSVGFVP